MDITAASTERTIHIRICHHLWIRAFNMYIFKIPGFYECPISWVHFKGGKEQKSKTVKHIAVKQRYKRPVMEGEQAFFYLSCRMVLSAAGKRALHRAVKRRSCRHARKDPWDRSVPNASAWWFPRRRAPLLFQSCRRTGCTRTQHP